MNGDQKPFDSIQDLTGKLDIQFALQATGLGVWELNTSAMQVLWDDRCRELFGLAADNILPYEEAIQFIHSDDVERVKLAVERALAGESNGVYDQTYRTIGADDGILRWVRFYGRSYFTPSGQLTRFAGVAQEVTSQIQAQQTVQESQARQTYLLTLSDHLRSLKDPIQIQYEAACLLGEQLGANRVGYAQTQADREIVAVTRHYTQGVPGIEGVYRYADYGLELLERMQAGQTVVHSDIAHDATLTDSQKEAHKSLYLGATLNVPLVKESKLVAILFVHYARAHAFSAHEVSLVEETAERIWTAVERARAEDALRESEQRFRRLADTLPQAIWITDPQGNVEFLNQWWADYSGISFTPITAWQVAQDSLHPEDAPRLIEAFGKAIEQQKGFAIEQRNRSASGEYRWFFNIGVPYRDAEDGPITHWVGCGVDIHELKRATQALQDSQSRLQSIIDLAELGSYTVDLATNRLTKSPRVAQWYGLPEITDVTTSLSAIAESDRARVSQVYAGALQPGSSGAFQAEYTVINQQTGYRRILRMIGQVIRNEVGQAVRVEGSLIDVTTQRAVQQALEQQVKERTIELAAANEALSATNAELALNNRVYAAINEELQEANFLLKRSNENLQQFASVASHDLQEPLRKIQQFSDLLKIRYADSTGEELAYLERMQLAASRMSHLIKDLLNFSRISTQRNDSGPVSLQTVVADVISTLELRVEELGAQIQVGPLPTVTGDSSQLGQLFQNLLSNALKFHRTDRAGVPVAPVIKLEARLLAADQLPPGINPSRGSTAYHQIAVIDNGIGFKQKYAGRIFQVFQRLHSQSEFPGTGIGLAICENVVTNHGGVITASSQPGEGANFTVYLPA